MWVDYWGGGGGGEAKGIPPPPSKIIGVGAKGVLPPHPLQNYWGAPPRSPSSYAYVSFVNVYQFVCLLLFLMVLRVGM